MLLSDRFKIELSSDEKSQGQSVLSLEVAGPSKMSSALLRFKSVAGNNAKTQNSYIVEHFMHFWFVLELPCTVYNMREFGVTIGACMVGSGSRFVEGCWGFRYLKIKRFLGFLVSRFLVFLCFLVFRISKLY